MRQFLRKRIETKEEELLMMVACMAVLLAAGYVILTWPS